MQKFKGFIFQLFLNLIFVLLSQKSHAFGEGLISRHGPYLPQENVQKLLPDLSEVYQVASNVFCNRENPNLEKIILEKSSALGFQVVFLPMKDLFYNFRINGRNSSFLAQILRSADHSQVDVMRVYYENLYEFKSEQDEAFTAFYYKEDSECQPYSISRVLYDPTGQASKRLMVTSTDYGIHQNELDYETASTHLENTDEVLLEQPRIILNLLDRRPRSMGEAPSSKRRISDTYQISFLTDRTYDESMYRLRLSSEDLDRHIGRRYLSVGEGNSDFIAGLIARGIDAWAVDSEVKNVHAPQKSIIAFAQRLPFPDEHFTRTVSIWLIPHFFNQFSIGNSDAGIAALAEMLRVTEVGGEVLINPLHLGGDLILAYFEGLRLQGKISYSVLYSECGFEYRFKDVDLIRISNFISRLVRRLGRGEHFGPALGNETITLKVKKLKSFRDEL